MESTNKFSHGKIVKINPKWGTRFR